MKNKSQTKILPIFIISLVVVSFLVSYFVIAQWTIDEPTDTVYFNDSRVYLSATPHTITSPSWVYFNVTSKTFTGEADFFWGFYGEDVKPTQAMLYKPHWINWTTDHSQYFFNVSSLNTTTESCNYGNEYNTYKRNATYQICGEWNETDFDAECLYYNTVSSIVCFDSYEPTPFTPNLNYTIYWQTKHSRLENWLDITNKFNKLSYDFQGMDTWYYLKNVSIEANQSYQIKAYVDMPITLSQTNGKYFWAIKRTIDTFEEAVLNDRFYYLDPWYSSSWNYRKNITIDHTKVDGEQTNFPILINITDTDLRDDAQNDGDDIVFTNTSGSKLDHEIEFFNSTTGWLVAWVRIPTLSNTANTTIQMYYNNSGASNQQNPTGVWDDNFVMIQHLQETDIDGGAGDIKDSTQFGNNGTTANMETADQVDGQVDGSFDFDGVDESVDCGDDVPIRLSGARTISTWIKGTYSATGLHTIVAKYGGVVSTNDYYLVVYQQKGRVLVTNSAGDTKISNSVQTLNDNQRYHLVMTWGGGAGSETKIYVNSIEDTSIVTNDSFSNALASTENLIIGARGEVAHAFFNGTIDEVRISNVSRSAGWINTSYQNQYSPSTFYTVGSEEIFDSVYPQFSNYWDDSYSLEDSGIGNFNVTVINTNGTVWLEVDGTNITATNLTSNVYNASHNFTSAGTYPYKWHSWGNGTNENYNVSVERSYVVNTSDTCICPSVDTNWEISLADYCNITSNCNIGTGNITFINNGSVLFNATITTNKLTIKDSSGVTEKYNLGTVCKFGVG